MKKRMRIAMLAVTVAMAGGVVAGGLVAGPAMAEDQQAPVSQTSAVATTNTAITMDSVFDNANRSIELSGTGIPNHYVYLTWGWSGGSSHRVIQIDADGTWKSGLNGLQMGENYVFAQMTADSQPDRHTVWEGSTDKFRATVTNTGATNEFTAKAEWVTIDGKNVVRVTGTGNEGDYISLDVHDSTETYRTISLNVLGTGTWGKDFVDGDPYPVPSSANTVTVSRWLNGVQTKLDVPISR
ncbi:hypothetical protein [Streptomyces sp. N35]|uniref:hypothetical protein n=1 Tax=Streptomyces sp. N35 TaxID=2795730 RepID=UPI0018F755C8|nr:hypothetical protein [Streptomyces sp. N35]